MKEKSAVFLFICAAALAQETTVGNIRSTVGNIRIEDAMSRARQYAGTLQSSVLTARAAGEDVRQARAARLPTVNAFNQFVYTEGNGTPSGVFVANDGVHIYNEQAVVHEELFALIRHGEVDRAVAAAAAAQARLEIARRGLGATVIADYYAIVAAQRRLVTARGSLGEAERFYDVTRKQESGGEAAHADVIKSQIELQQRQRDVEEAALAVDKAKIALGVMIFPKLTTDYSVFDDLDEAASLPESGEAHAASVASSPDLKAAREGVRQAQYEVTIARYQWLPSLALDFFYGIDANQLAARTGSATQATGRGTLPNYTVEGRQNLGYSAQATLNIPVWNWGTTRSRIRQAEYKQEQAKVDLSVAQKTLESASATANLEARGAARQLDSLRSSVDLAAESLRLTVLRYQAGEATALEVVDAQNTALLSRNAYDDGLARYHVALANLRLLMGTL